MSLTSTRSFVMTMILAVAFAGCAEQPAAPDPPQQPGPTAPEDDENGRKLKLDIGVDVGDGGVQVDVGDDGVQVDVGDDGVNVDVGGDGVNVDIGNDGETDTPTEQP
jgi:hypothetical protein